MLLVLKMKEPILMSFSYVLSKGKDFYLNFRLAKRKENLNALSCPIERLAQHFFLLVLKNKLGLKIAFLCVSTTAYSFLWENT